ncbi:3'-5' exonuclease [Sphingorhabdus sp. EL138]|uniref:3'-5' exonuclease n=1 Tax=Sphingorhabdus sp. EL138 TaxID=2073156 RepID=UPI003455C977
MKRRVLIDIETTALTPQRGEIIRLYARDLDDPCSTFNQLVKPKHPLSNLVQQITEITNEMLGDAPSIEAVMPHFSNFLDGAELMSDSVDFDLRFLKQAVMSYRNGATTDRACSM